VSQADQGLGGNLGEGSKVPLSVMRHSALHQNSPISSDPHRGGILWDARSCWTERAPGYFHKGGEANTEKRIALRFAPLLLLCTPTSIVGEF